eukprot:358612-Chlamydomonas_euryale.AAC.4
MREAGGERCCNPAHGATAAAGPCPSVPVLLSCGKPGRVLLELSPRATAARFGGCAHVRDTGGMNSSLFFVLPALTQVALDNNMLTGTLPMFTSEQFPAGQQLRTLLLASNPLAGSLPNGLASALTQPMDSLDMRGTLMSCCGLDVNAGAARAAALAASEAGRLSQDIDWPAQARVIPGCNPIASIHQASIHPSIHPSILSPSLPPSIHPVLHKRLMALHLVNEDRIVLKAYQSRVTW